MFDSAVPDYFIAHYDLLKPLSDSTGLAPGPTGMHPVPDLMVRLSRLNAVTIASIRGARQRHRQRARTRRRHALRKSREGHPVPIRGRCRFCAGRRSDGTVAAVWSGAAAPWRSCSADDIDGDLAERYGYVNRALPDAELDGFVDALAFRIASFDRQALIDTKKPVNLATMPPDAEMQPGWDAFIASVQRPAAQARLKALVEKGLQRVGNIERNLGHYTATYKQ